VTARDNGLRASRYVALVDLAPEAADALLAVLRDEGVAAYAAAADVTALDAAGTEERRDQVWVDADGVERARGVLRTRLPGLRRDERADVGAESDEGADVGAGSSRIDEEAAWQAIVAGLREPDSQTTAPQPAAPNQADLPEKDDHYVPPPPPPLPAADTVTKLGWAGLVGGPAYLLLATITGRGLSERAAIVAVTAFVVGFVTLVARMKDRPPMDSGPDDGAVV
jgi:hypothetical protein